MSDEKKAKTHLKVSLLLNEKKQQEPPTEREPLKLDPDQDRFAQLFFQDPDFLQKTGSDDIPKRLGENIGSPLAKDDSELNSFSQNIFCCIQKNFKDGLVLVVIPGTITSILRRGLELANQNIPLSPAQIVVCAAEFGAVSWASAFLADMLMRVAAIYKREGETFNTSLYSYFADGHWLESVKTGLRFSGHAAGWTTGYQIADYFYHSQYKVFNVLVRGLSAAAGTILPSASTLFYDKDAKKNPISQVIMNLAEGFFRSIIVDSQLCEVFLNKGLGLLGAKTSDALSVGAASALLYTLGILIRSNVREFPTIISYPTRHSSQLAGEAPNIQEGNVLSKRYPSLLDLCYPIWSCLKKLCCSVDANDSSYEDPIRDGVLLPDEKSNLSSGFFKSHTGKLPTDLSGSFLQVPDITSPSFNRDNP